MKRASIYLFLLAIIVVVYSCRKDYRIIGPAPSNTTVSISTLIPSGFPSLSSDLNIRIDNPLTEEGIALGRRLFYDVKLSGNNTQSCGSCHIQKYAFTNGPDLPLSFGADGISRTKRNTPSTFNLLWAKHFMWDGSQPGIEEQATGPITNPVEMNQDLKLLVNELQSDPNYPALFKKAFGSDSITIARVQMALGQFERTIISGSSKFDLFMQRKVNFTPDEYAGLAIFQSMTLGDCVHCHSLGGTFTDFAFKHNGLDTALPGSTIDVGRFGITHQGFDSMMFKTPSLRNIALTSPYMHDGRFKTLEEVVEFYDHGYYRNKNLDVNMALLPKNRMTATQKAQLVTFLKTLTDTVFTKDPKLSNPF